MWTQSTRGVPNSRNVWKNQWWPRLSELGSKKLLHEAYILECIKRLQYKGSSSASSTLVKCGDPNSATCAVEPPQDDSWSWKAQ